MRGRALASERLAADRTAAAPIGEPEFAAFYARIAPRLRAYLRRLTGDAALADDLMQEACVRLLRSARAGASEAEHAGFLYRSATNLAFDHWRRRRREARAHGWMQRQASPRAEPAPGNSDVGRLFEALRPRDRALLWLAHVEGRDHREIGRLLGVRAISVRVLLFRARAELARRIRRAGLAPGRRTG